MGKRSFSDLFDQNIQLFHFLLQLNPPDRELKTDWQTELDDAKEYVRKLNVISTNKDKEIDVDTEKDEFEVNFVRYFHGLD